MNRLPVEITAVEIMPMLGLKDFINLETAVVRVPAGWQAAVHRTVPLELNENLHNYSAGLLSIFEHGFKIKRMCLVTGKSFDKIMEIVDSYNYAVGEVTLNINKNSEASSELLAKCTSLTIMKSIESVFFDEISTHAVNLVSLKLPSDSSENDERKLQALGIVTQKLRLKVLSISVKRLNGKLAKVLQPVGSFLEKLELKVSAFFTRYIDQLCKIVAFCPNLTSLTVMGEHDDEEDEELMEDDGMGGAAEGEEEKDWLVALAKSCPRLQLFQASTYLCTFRGICAVVQGCRQLHTLIIFLTANTAAALAEACAPFEMPLRNM